MDFNPNIDFEPQMHAADDETLQQWRANVKTTKCLCIGHHKTERNEQRLAQIEAYMRLRRIVIDTEVKGKFNGPGSY